MENQVIIGNRVDCLYRVSTDKQVDYNDKSQADIPMQRKECHRFCEKWAGRLFTRNRRTVCPATRYGPKTGTSSKSSRNEPSRASSIFCLLFMFDRIGRIADETPFVVEWFVKNGIRVWSTQEGEQRFDNHTGQTHQLYPLLAGGRRKRKNLYPHENSSGPACRGGRFQRAACPLWLRPCKKWTPQQAQA